MGRRLKKPGLVLFLLFLSSSLSTVLNAGVLDAPTALTATAVSSNRIDLAWLDTNNSEHSFRIERRLAGGTWAHIGTTSKDVRTYSDIALQQFTTYYYQVLAVAPSSTSGYSNEASARTLAEVIAPSVPTGLTATAVSCGQVNLFWAASTDTGGSGVAGYKVFRNGAQIATTAVTSFSSTGLSASTLYTYRVAAYDGAGNTSAQSTAASATTSACVDTIAPSVPTGLTAAAAGCSQVNRTWAASTNTGGSGLAGYKVFRNGAQIATTSATTFNSTGLAASTLYTYRVAAYDGSANTSAQSTAASATTPACADTTAPSVPAGLTATAVSCSRVNLNWAASTDTGGSGLAGYTVFRNGIQIATTALLGYSDTGVVASTLYTYRVAAYDGAGYTSAQSTAASATTPACTETTAPSVPTGLSAAAVSCSQVDLTWAASTDTGGSGMAGYKVFRNGTQIATTSLTSFSSTNLAASTPYTFTVAAYDNAGNTSAQSTAASRTTPACPDPTAPSVPTGLTATASSCTQVNLS